MQNSGHVAQWVEESIKDKAHIAWKTIGETTLGRPLWVLDMTHGDPAAKPLVVFLPANIHLEVTGFFAFKAFMQEVMGDSPAAKTILENYRVLAFPWSTPMGWTWDTGAIMPGG